jgi:hypothetical protein
VRDPAAFKVLDNIPYRLSSGQHSSLGEIARILHSLGGMDQFEEGMALAGRWAETGSLPKKVQWLAEGGQLGDLGRVDRVVGDILSPAYLARVGENYQRLLGFMGFLKDTSPEGIAQAWDLTSKFMGNYRRLGKMEQALNDVVGFYAWQRFIYPHIVQQMWENPQRMAAFVHWRQSQSDSWSQPLTEHALPSYMEGAVASAVRAPEETLKQLRSGDHVWATMENPLSMGLAFVPMLRGALKGAGNENEQIAKTFGWLGQLGMELLMGQTMAGAPIPAEVSLGNFMSEKLVGKLPGEAINLVRLYATAGQPMNAQRLAMQLSAGRFTLGLDEPIANLLGIQPQSLGGMFSSTGEVGKFVYPGSMIDYERNQKAAWEAATKRKDFEDVSRILKQVNEMRKGR